MLVLLLLLNQLLVDVVHMARGLLGDACGRR